MSAPSLKRDIGPISLLFTGLGAMIGSGWLFGAERAAVLAGPGAIFAWIIGAIVVFILGAVASELGTMFPVSGGIVRYARVTHGPLVGFIAAYANWISIVSVIPIEAEASVQYLSSWPYHWTHALFQNGQLSPTAMLLASALVIFYFLLNFWGVRLFATANSVITIFKLVVPLLTGLGLIFTSFHPGNITDAKMGGVFPFGPAGVLTAVATSGIIFAFNGFQSPLSLAGEARNPSRTIPFSILGSIVLAAVIYLVLQIAFITVLNPITLKAGWGSLSFSSPFAQLALALNLNWLAFVLYADAFVSPSGAGITDMATTSRMILGMQRDGVAPEILGRIHPLYRVPRPALWFNLALCFVFLYFFRGWGKLAATISVATAVSFLMIPISAISLRRSSPQLPRPFRIPGMQLWATIAFVSSSELLYWARWPLTAQVILVLLVSVPVYAWFRRKASKAALLGDLKASIWLICFLPTIAVISLLGSREFGGAGVIPFGWDMLIVALISLGFCEWGVRSAERNPVVADLETLEIPELAPVH